MWPAKHRDIHDRSRQRDRRDRRGSASETEGVVRLKEHNRLGRKIIGGKTIIVRKMSRVVDTDLGRLVVWQGFACQNKSYGK